MRKLILDWCHRRNNTPDANISETDAILAAECGFPTLSSINSLLSRFAAGHDYISRGEIQAELRNVLAVATGEAQARIVAFGLVGVEIPGVPQIPRRLFESMAGDE